MNKKSNCQRASEAYVKTRRNKTVGAIATAGVALLSLNLSTDANAAIVSGTNFKVNGFNMENPTLPDTGYWAVGCFYGDWYSGPWYTLSFQPNGRIGNRAILTQPGSYNNIKFLGSGYQISAGRRFDFTGYWPEQNGQSGYIGFVLSDWDPDLEQSFERYGWIEASVNAAGDAITLHSWAYEDVAGQPITAGDTGSPVPVPGSLALLASGAAGLAALRRRKPAAA